MAVRCSTDLTVVGGGLAGVCAAVAAREGLQVALVGNRPVLGGNIAARDPCLDERCNWRGSRYGEEMGILGELKMENLYKNPDSNPYLWDAIILDFVAREKNIIVPQHPRTLCRHGSS